MNTPKSYLASLLCIVLAIAAITYGATPKNEERSTLEKQLLAEAQQTNKLLLNIHETLVEMNRQEELKKTNELLEQADEQLASIAEQMGESRDAIQRINSNINNSKNPVCVLEQLEDIKSALTN